jgi:hypothetical protein
MTGLDIPTVQLVVNHVIPNVPKDYVHRVGRTARAGRGGRAISLVSPRDINLLRAIEDAIHTKLTEHTVDGKIHFHFCCTGDVTKLPKIFFFFFFFFFNITDIIGLVRRYWDPPLLMKRKNYTGKICLALHQSLLSPLPFPQTIPDVCAPG